MATETILPSTAAPQKVSRYRSVRRAQEQQTQHLGQFQQQHSSPAVPPLPPMPAVPEMQAPNEAPVSRSMSRYHRRPTTSQPNAPPLRANTQPLPPGTQAPSSAIRNRAVSSPQHASHSANIGQPRPRTAKQRSEASPPASSSARQQPLSGDDSARQLMQRERERQRLLKEKYDAEARAAKEAKLAEIDRLERLRKEEEEVARLQAQQEAQEKEALRRQKEELRAEQERGKRLRKAETQRVLQQREEEVRKAKLEEKERKAKLEEKARHAATSSPPVSPPRHDAAFGLFKRRRDAGLTSEAPAKPSSPPRSSLSLDDREPETIRPGGGGAVLGIDAPTSAVNAGDRRVTVVCNKKRIQLPVTPTTTPLDLIKSAATILTDSIDVRTAAVSELVTKVSIIRPLRNYEYVRDVMNSWDYDSQNSLTIIDSQLDGIDQDDLLAYKVPDNRPEGMSCFIQYSSRPGKWSKRYLTLRPDGQLVMAKNEKAKEKDQENICTLTDYDIYSVTQQKLTRVKPPKKICFAVKSMQKSNIFADESQYVHFFCTNDRGTAMIFYKALQSWRSWYLKHQKGEGLKKKAPTSRNVSGSGDQGHMTSSHTRGESVGSHYQLGAFSSLLDLDDFNKALDSIEVHKPGEYPDNKPLGKFDTKAMHARKKSLRVRQPPPPAFNRSAMAMEGGQDSMRRSIDQQEEDTFAAGGLLGRSYTQRQAVVQAREQQNGPFTEGPSLLNNMGRVAQVSTNESGLKRNSSVRSNHHRRTSSELQRSASKRIPGMPEPLIDLTPQYRPPPQFANKGKGYNPGAAAGPLVESATSIEEAIKVPSSTDWRARPTTSRAAHGTYGTGGHERTRSLKGRGEPLAAYTQNNHTGAPDDDSNAFTGGGLLATAGYSQGHAPVGRGVMDGSKAKGPMLNVNDNNQFAQGSLLSALPNSNGPIIDRSGK
ncbi:Nn.00g083030.m01.CDS01 [Neocucurbitaria sp. VM-36]